MNHEPSMRRLAEERDLHAIFAIYMHKSVVPFLGFDPMPLEGFRPVYHPGGHPNSPTYGHPKFPHPTADPMRR